MKTTFNVLSVRLFGIIALTAIMGIGLTGCSSPVDSLTDQTPTVADYDIGNLTQTVGSVTDVAIAPKQGKSGGKITIYYEGTGGTAYARSTTPPTSAGTYIVTFDVAAATGYKAAYGLSAGTLTVKPVGGNPTAVLDRITAEYAAVEAIFPDTTLHTLKDGLTVKAHYADNTETALAMDDYELSGTLTVGNSVITVSYQGKTTTFTVTVRAPHTHAWGEWIVTTPATCTEAGEEKRECTADPPHYETRTIEAIGHDWGAWTQTKAPTETEDGEETRTCKHDSTHTGTRAIAALNHTHDWGEWEVTTPATCTHTGEKKRICTLNAAHYETETIPIDPDAHNYANWTQTTAPTCTTAGVETGTCTHDPTHTDTRTIAIDPNAHNWGEWRQTTAPTCTTAGIKTRACTHNSSHIDPQTQTGDAALGHDWEWKVTTPATYTADGVETETCKHDSTHTQDTRPIPQIPFTSIADFGTWLSSQPTNTPTTAYNVKLNVSNFMTGDPYYGSAASVLNINNTKYVNLDLSGSTFTSIPQDAFRDRANLTSVTIGNSVESIGQAAFYNCSGLTSVVFPTNTSFTRIESSTFYGCTSLTSVTIPDSVESILGGVFYGCTSLSSVTIGSGLTSIIKYHESWLDTFGACTSLTAINVDVNNTEYSSQDGVLYNKDKTTLIHYPLGKTGTTFSIPNSVKTIGGLAFSQCTSLKSIAIPDSVESIGRGAFSGCNQLTSVTIGNSVESIGNNAFNGCTSLTGALTIPDSVTSIGSYAFYRCNQLTSVTIGNSVKTIGVHAFSSCSGLTGVLTIPDSVTSIGENAFESCRYLTSVTIGNGVTSIGRYAFNLCNNLTSVTFVTGSNIASSDFGYTAFPEGSGGNGGNSLMVAYYDTGKEGTYTRPYSGTTWTKS